MRSLCSLAAAIFVNSLCACSPPPAQLGPDGSLTLALPRRPAVNEMLMVNLTVGRVSANTKIVIRTADGEIAGTIAPFGVKPGQKAGIYSIAVPAKAIADAKVTLKLELVDKQGQAVRAPTKAEIEDAKLAFSPVSVQGKEKK